jgi:hypothetical protein
MSQFIKTIITSIIALSLLLCNLNFPLNLNIEAKTKDNQTISKKLLKRRLSLNYTADRFEFQLNSNQKQAILKSLKKWKGELPIDNKFTITHIANLKSDTLDASKHHKKQKTTTQNALVIYMRSQTQNPNYNPNNANENEEEDSKHINTEFNVLLKQNKNGNWMASLERDSEVKTESADIIETDEDAQIYKDLFATDIADNAFTATEEVLIDPLEQSPYLDKFITHIA